MIVAVHGIYVSCAIDAHIHELMPIAHRCIRVVVHHVIRECFPPISRDCHPHHMVAARTARSLTKSSDAAKGLVDDVSLRIDHQVPDLIVIHKEEMARIKRITQLRECRSCIGYCQLSNNCRGNCAGFGRKVGRQPKFL